MRGLRALVAAVIVMGVMIVLGTAVLIGVVVKRATHGTTVAASVPASPAQAMLPGQAYALALDQPPGTHIVAVVRQSDTLLAITLAGGGSPDRLLIWDIAAGRVAARLTLSR